MATRILLVEDEEHLQEVIKMNLEMEGYVVSAVTSGKEALMKFEGGRFDLILLDVMLPEMDGFTVCETIRLTNKSVPILFMTAKNTSKDRITGLKIGGDDYLAKPFDLEELLLRVQNLLKRSVLTQEHKKEISSYQFGRNKVNFDTYEIQTKDGETKHISKKEVLLLKLLIERNGEVVSRDEILEKIWGYDVYPSTRTIDNFILSFRKYFEINPREPRYFHSVRGVGYKFLEKK